MSRQLVLKVDVDTWRGTCEGVPRLVDLFQRYQVGATFLFSLGPDHTGRALKRVFRPGFLRKVSRTSVLSHYGWRTLLYGVLLPGPDIGRQGAAILQQVQQAGFEVGIHCWDHVAWQDQVPTQTSAWTARQLESAVMRFRQVFGCAPLTHGAAGWQMNEAAYRQQLALGLRYASDSRGTAPYWPMNEAGEVIGVPQLPTTLPTLDELLGRDGWQAENVHEALLALSAEANSLQVFTLHAELEGQKLLPVLERLLQGWLAQGYQLVSGETALAGLNLPHLPKHYRRRGEVPGRSGELELQGPPYLAA
ncbi:polysaccharide deacetylase family protein [Chitinibacter tainanensis]|uniref:polysaccharide deacetylase family protein n=1 Tax=Chitinibacter tainanensis TaxID=230667 RepID=UPI00048AEAA7|nr:polysaccharide deacetylase family protein [Chitinibacter tainanensis]